MAGALFVFARVDILDRSEVPSRRVQNGKRDGKREGRDRDDDYAFGHHGNPLDF